MLLWRLFGAVPVIFAAMTPSEMRLLSCEAVAVDQLSPAADAPALVKIGIGCGFAIVRAGRRVGGNEAVAISETGRPREVVIRHGHAIPVTVRYGICIPR